MKEPLYFVSNFAGRPGLPENGEGMSVLTQDLDCLFIGSSTKDILMVVDAPPASDQRISASHFTITCGGVSNIAGAAHQNLGGVTGVISAVGGDETSDFIRQFQEEQGFAYTKLFTFPDQFSSTSLVQVEKNGKRCLTCFGGCIDCLTFDMLDKDLFHHTRMVHLGVMRPELMLEICRYCKENTQALISIDSGNLSRENTDLLLPYTDIFIPDNKTVAKTLGGSVEDACRYYISHGAKIACVTSGEEGPCAFDGTQMYHIGAPKVHVLDTTGAGDNFHGAFLYCLGQGMELPQAVKFANIYASLTCEGLGGHTVVPTREQVMARFDTI